MTLFIGVDIAKDTHYAAMTNQHGEILIEAFPFRNTSEGFNLFLSAIMEQSSNTNDLLVGFESTAHYAENFSYFLDQHSISYILLNPLETSSLRKQRIRITKTDSIDAPLIAQALCLHLYSKHKHVMKRSRNNAELYSLCSSRHNLMDMRTKCKIQFVAFMDRLFPELSMFFDGNLHLNTVYSIIDKYPSAHKIAKVRIDTLAKLIEEASHGRFKKDKAEELKKLAKASVGIMSSAFELQAQLAVNQIRLYTEQIKSIDLEIERMVNDTETTLLSVPGLSSNSIGVILSVTDNFSNFDSPCKVLAYAGLDPIVNQSGKWKAQRTRMSKRGNSLLRYTLILAADNVRKHDSTFASYYLKKRQEGKTHYCALGHCAGKLIRVLFKLVKSNTNYESQE